MSWSPGGLRAQCQRDQRLVACAFKRAPPEPLLALTTSLLARALEDRPTLERDRRVALAARGGATQIQCTRLISVLGRCSRDPPDSRSVCRSSTRDRAARHLDPPRRPEAPADIKEYTNRPVLDGSTANVFAGKYIAVHLKALGPGQTYRQLSAQSLTNPPNPKLVQETQTLFRGETVRAGCSRPGAYASRTFWALTGGRPTHDLPGPGRRRDIFRRSPLKPDVAASMPARAAERFAQIGA